VGEIPEYKDNVYIELLLRKTKKEGKGGKVLRYEQRWVMRALS
jgi:hypothetical protein